MRFAGKILALVSFALSLAALGVVLFLHGLKVDLEKEVKTKQDERAALDTEIKSLEKKMKADNGESGIWDKVRLEALEVKRVGEDSAKLILNENTVLTGKRTETEQARKNGEEKRKEHQEAANKHKELVQTIRKLEVEIADAKKKKLDLTQERMNLENELAQAMVKLDILSDRNDGLIDRKKELEKNKSGE